VGSVGGTRDPRARVVCGARGSCAREQGQPCLVAAFVYVNTPPPKRQIDGSGVAKPVIGSHHQPLGRSLTVVPRPWSFPATLSPSPFVAL